MAKKDVNEYISRHIEKEIITQFDRNKSQTSSGWVKDTTSGQEQPLWCCLRSSKAETIFINFHSNISDSSNSKWQKAYVDSKGHRDNFFRQKSSWSQSPTSPARHFLYWPSSFVSVRILDSSITSASEWILGHIFSLYSSDWRHVDFEWISYKNQVYSEVKLIGIFALLKMKALNICFQEIPVRFLDPGIMMMLRM